MDILNKNEYEENDHILNIIGDMHNLYSLKDALSKFDKLISLGDIGAAIKKEELFKNDNFERYNKCWKAFASKDFSLIKKEDKNWFKKINIFGWKNQLDAIKDAKNNIIITAGNSDIAMISFFHECLNYLNKILKETKMDFIKDPSLKVFRNIQMIFLPYSKEEYDLNKKIKNINLNKSLFVLGHCPPFKTNTKNYYMNVYNALGLISTGYKKNFYYMHGHVHPTYSYRYFIKGLPNITCLTPKAEESFEGIGINHDVIQINTKDSSFNLVNLNSGNSVSFQNLPKNFLMGEGHWNDFESKLRK